MHALCCARPWANAVVVYDPKVRPGSGDVEVVRALLAKGANPNINAMGVTPFLVAAGVNAGHIGGTGLAASIAPAAP